MSSCLSACCAFRLLYILYRFQDSPSSISMERRGSSIPSNPGSSPEQAPRAARYEGSTICAVGHCRRDRTRKPYYRESSTLARRAPSSVACPFPPGPLSSLLRAPTAVFLPRLRHFVLTIVPALIALVVVGFALFGDHGLFRRHELRRQLAEMQSEVIRLERENLLLQREIKLVRERPEAIRRAAAEELLVAPRGSTIYRFSEPKEPERRDLDELQGNM